ncbi:DNA invertase Pin-like site-specific DNA recombinase [Arthrobacter sp. UYEF21]
MTGQTFGYVRVSSLDKNTIRQLDGEHLDRVFMDQASGKDQNRQQLDALIDFARDGDTVLVHSMDRLARNLEDLRAIVRRLTEKKVQVRFVKENLTFTGDDTAMATFLLSVMGAFAEFERALIRERQREGITLAKKAGIYKGRGKALNPRAGGRPGTACRRRRGESRTRPGIRGQPPNRLPIPSTGPQ